MTAQTYRPILAQAAIVLAVCIGAWMIFVKPKVDAVAKHEQTLAEHAIASATAFNAESVTHAANRMSAIRQRAAEIKTFNALSGDTSRLYGQIMDLADAHRIQVQSLQPNSVSQSYDDRVSVTRISLSAQGEYDNLALFLEAVCSLNAFVKPIGVDMTPSRAAGTTLVDLNFSCDFMSFTMDESLTSMGADHAQP